MSLPLCRLGRSGLMVSRAGLGCWAIGGELWNSDGVNRVEVGWGRADDDGARRAIERALELGVTIFDTADVYGAGHSERVLGDAVRDVRDKVVLATKFGAMFDVETKTFLAHAEIRPTVDAIRRACEASLERLGTDSIDLYQFHDARYDVRAAESVRDALEQLAADGMIRWYGWSTDDPERARVFSDGDRCTALQFRLNITRDAPELIELCRERDLAAVIRSPMGSGLLTGKYSPSSTFPDDDWRRHDRLDAGPVADRLERFLTLRELLTSDGRTMAQAVLSWAWTRCPEAILIPGFRTVEQVEENLAAASLGPLTETQMQTVEDVLRPAS